ncbi:MAG: PilC/PilY family type IV pilus protein [Granulosicoccus sp.]
MEISRANKFQCFAKAWLLCLFSGIAGADDTEVFFGSASSSGETRPNVMFVLDTSGSMGSMDDVGVSRLDRMKDAVKQLIRSDLDMNIGLMNYSGDSGGGPVLYPITTLTQVVCDTRDGDSDCLAPGELADNVYRVDGGLGDIEEETNGTVLTNGIRLELGELDGHTDNQVGLRYADINIARGATILGARLEFVAQGDHANAAELYIQVEDIADAQPYDGSVNSLSSRTYDSATAVAWRPEDWFDGNVYQSADIASQVQKIVSRDDWCTGNAMAFYVAGTAGTGPRMAYTHERAANEGVDYMPKLRIIQDPPAEIDEEDCAGIVTTVRKKIIHDDDDAEYEREDDDPYDRGDMSLGGNVLTMRGGSDENDTVSLRFTDLAIPKDAVIESAVLKLKATDRDTGHINVDIYIEDSVQAVRYGYSDWNAPISTHRSFVSTPVAWNNIPNWQDNEEVETPDLTTLVQSMVSDSAWDENNNAIGFLFLPTAGDDDREFHSFDASERYSDAVAPELVITFTDSSVSSTTTSTAIPSTAGTSTSTATGPLTIEAREEMIDVIDGLTASGYTPTVDAFYEAARYMRGEGVVYGKQRGLPSNPRRERFRVSHPESYTGGTVVRSSSCSEFNLTSAACSSEYISGNPVYISPMTGSCQANHIVLLSDGETNKNSSTAAIRTMINKVSCDAVADGDELCATDLAEWLLETDHSTGESGLGDVQDIKTHTIAFNLDGNGKDFLERVAAAGGGSAHEADTADELLGVFNDLVTTIVDIDTGFTAPAITINQFNRLTHREDLYFALFKPGESALWNGNLKRFRMGKQSDGTGEVTIRDIDGNPAVNASTGFFKDSSRSFWPERDDDGNLVTEADGNTVARGGAANQLRLEGLEVIDTRRMYTWLSDASTQITEAVDLTAVAQKFHESNTGITDEILGIADIELDEDAQEVYRTKLLQWARGMDVLDSDGDDDFIDSRRSIGDPMHSRPVLVTYAPTETNSEPRSLVFLGTNEGFLHAFDTSNGQEQFAFIPYELLKNLNTFLDNEPGFQRPYGLDGVITLWRDDVNDNQMIDGEDSALLFVGMRRGGTSYYALDISNPDLPKLAWTIKGGPGGTAGFETMGQSWSRLTPVTMYIEGNAEDVLVFGGGYDENQDPDGLDSARTQTSDDYGSGIYIVKASTGELLWSGKGTIGGDEFFADMEYGFNSNIRTIDINRDGYVDQMYAADVGGQVWRFDMAQYHTNAADQLVFGGVVADFSGSLPADQRRFYNEPDVALIENGGERYLSVSIGSGWRAHPLDEVTDDRFYMLRQYSVYDKPEGYGKNVDDVYSKITEEDLINVTSTVDPEVNEYGWYLDFTRTGEKVLGTSVTFDNSVIFSTYVPTQQSAVCAAEIGGGRAYVLDVANGAPAANLDKAVDPDPTVTASVLTLTDQSVELSRSGIPPEAMVVLTEESGDEPQILIGGEQLSTGITNSTRRTFWSDEDISGDILVTEQDSDNGNQSNDD